MKLEITNKDNSLPSGFGDWLKGIVQDKILSSLEETRLLLWNEYLNSDGVIDFASKKSILAKEIIMYGVSNLRVLKLPQKFIIEINPNAFMFGLNSTKIEKLCRLINYGNASIKGYPIFSRVFSEVAENIDSYVETYLRIFGTGDT
jgi:hypothetical protein